MGLKTLGMSLGVPYRFAETMAWPYMMAMTRREWRGQEHLGVHGEGVIVAFNHISWFDPLVTAHFLHDSGRPPRYMAKQEVFSAPGVGALLRSAGQIPVDRDGDASDALAAARTALAAGECVAVYPEGTITREPNVWPMTGKTGAVRLAIEAGVPLIPVAQWGANKVIGPYKKEFHPFPPKLMQVHAGPPLDIDDLRSKPITADGLRDGTARLMGAITELLASIRGEQPPTEPFDWATRKRRHTSENNEKG